MSALLLRHRITRTITKNYNHIDITFADSDCTEIVGLAKVSSIFTEVFTMIKDLRDESNAALLSALLNVPVENLECEKISDILQAPLSIKGIGAKKAKKLYVVMEIIRRILQEPPAPPLITCPEDVVRHLYPKLLYETKEHFMLALINAANRLVATPTISIGSLTRATVHPREIFKEVLKYPCVAIFLVHNHPSGNATPSKEDIDFTEILVKAGHILEIPVLDHIIIANHRYISMKKDGYMD